MKTIMVFLTVFMMTVHYLCATTMSDKSLITDERTFMNDGIGELSPKTLKEMKEIFDFLYKRLNNPSDGDIIKVNRQRDTYLKQFKENEEYSRAKVFMYLIRFFDEATDPKKPNPERACQALYKAVKAYHDLKGIDYSGEIQAKKVYKEGLGIDLDFLKQLYDTDYVRSKGFTYEKECPCNTSGLNNGGAIYYKGALESDMPFQPSRMEGSNYAPEDQRTLVFRWQQRESGGEWTDIPNARHEAFSPPMIYVSTAFKRSAKYTCQDNWQYSNIVEFTVNTIADTIYLQTGLVINGPDGASYWSKDGEQRDAGNIIKLLRQMVNSGLLNTELFEIRQLVEGDSRWIPGQNGVPYEITFRHEETFSTILFPVGEYVITDLDPRGAWDPYRKSMDMISTCVIKVLDQFGGSAFRIMTQGMADAPTFTPKPLVAGYHDEFFRRISILYYSSSRSLLSREITIDVRYNNNDLPDLRGAFLARALLRRDFMEEHQDKVFIFKGRVTEKTDPKDRNASIVIWIDWDAANRHYAKHHSTRK
jgi:hypothetical protein